VSCDEALFTADRLSLAQRSAGKQHFMSEGWSGWEEPGGGGGGGVAKVEGLDKHRDKNHTHVLR